MAVGHPGQGLGRGEVAVVQMLVQLGVGIFLGVIDSAKSGARNTPGTSLPAQALRRLGADRGLNNFPHGLQSIFLVSSKDMGSVSGLWEGTSYSAYMNPMSISNMALQSITLTVAHMIL